MAVVQPKFAVFDIDGTLMRWQLFHAIVHELGKQGFLSVGAHEKIRSARFAWKNRLSKNGFADYEAVLVELYIEALQNLDAQEYRLIVDQVFSEYKDQTFTYTRDLAAKLKAQGYLLFAISGSQQEIVERIGHHHGFDAAVGARLVMKNSAFTGEIVTPIHNKAAALQRLVDQYHCTYDESYGVGDSPSDSSMLDKVAHPIAFNPDQKLYDIAQDKGWQVVVERKNVVYELPKPKAG
ncbi:HAD-IB family hydrolase [Candidatus Saccharibacteria bacterium]|nr:HAD-IB family hydrolase [Candidatus Saccharibacteria bacterium]HPR08997.1 HAD-IB family hydrolase [Candidatus Saccharibacteria bacterium]